MGQALNPGGRPIKRTVMVFLLHGREVLLLLHKKGKSWMGPGGHIEDDETAIEAVTRELFEEVGVVYSPVFEKAGILDRSFKVPAPQFVRTYNGFEGFDDGFLYEDQVFIFQVDRSVRDQELNPKEGHEVAWVPLREAVANYEMYHEVRQLLLEVEIQKELAFIRKMTGG